MKWEPFDVGMLTLIVFVLVAFSVLIGALMHGEQEAAAREERARRVCASSCDASWRYRDGECECRP